MPRVQIDQVVNRPEPYQPQGKNFRVHEVQCNGSIDNVPAQGFIVKTLSDKAATYIQPGLVFNAEVDEYQGTVKYKIPKHMYHEGGSMSHPLQQGMPPGDHTGGMTPPTYTPPQNVGGAYPPVTGTPPPMTHQPHAPYAPVPTVYTPPPAPKPAVTFDSLVDMHLAVYGKVNEVYPDLEEKVKASIVATLFIECNKKGVVPVNDDNKNFADLPPAGAPPVTMNNPMQNHMMVAANQIMMAAGLGERVETLKSMGMLTNEVIIQWFTQSQGNENTFKIRVHDELEKLGG